MRRIVITSAVVVAAIAALLIGTVVAIEILRGQPAAEKPQPSPTGSVPDEQAYLDALEEIDPALVENPGRAIRRGKSICREFDEGKTRYEISESAADLFNVDFETGVHIMAAAEQHLCVN